MLSRPSEGRCPSTRGTRGPRTTSRSRSRRPGGSKKPSSGSRRPAASSRIRGSYSTRPRCGSERAPPPPPERRTPPSSRSCPSIRRRSRGSGGSRGNQRVRRSPARCRSEGSRSPSRPPGRRHPSRASGPGEPSSPRRGLKVLTKKNGDPTQGVPRRVDRSGLQDRDVAEEPHGPGHQEQDRGKDVHGVVTSRSLGTSIAPLLGRAARYAPGPASTGLTRRRYTITVVTIRTTAARIRSWISRGDLRGPAPYAGVPRRAYFRIHGSDRSAARVVPPRNSVRRYCSSSRSLPRDPRVFACHAHTGIAAYMLFPVPVRVFRTLTMGARGPPEG